MRNKTRAIGILAAVVVAALSLFALWGCAEDKTPTPVEKEIATADEFLSIANYTGAKYAGSVFTLTEDLDFTGMAYLPIGTVESPFVGKIDGNGHKITGIELFEEEGAPALGETTGLFGAAQNAAFQNFSVDIKIYRRLGAKGNYLGAVLGVGYGDITVDGVKASFELNTKFETYSEIDPSTQVETISTDCAEYAGGLVGFTNGNFKIENCETVVMIGEDFTEIDHSAQDLPRKSIFMGGIAGYAVGKGAIENCKVTMTGFSATAETVYAGGVAGFLTGAEIKDVAVGFSSGLSTLRASGDAAKGSFGGIVGYARNAELSDVGFLTGEGRVIRVVCDHPGKEPFQFGGIAGYFENSKLWNGKVEGLSAAIVNGSSYGGIAGAMRGGLIDGAAVSGKGFDFKIENYNFYLKNGSMRISALVGEVKGAAVVKNAAAAIRANTVFGKLTTEQNVDEDGAAVGEARVPIVSENVSADEDLLIVAA